MQGILNWFFLHPASCRLIHLDTSGHKKKLSKFTLVISRFSINVLFEISVKTWLLAEETDLQIASMDGQQGK